MGSRKKKNKRGRPKRSRPAKAAQLPCIIEKLACCANEAIAEGGRRNTFALAAHEQLAAVMRFDLVQRTSAGLRFSVEQVAALQPVDHRGKRCPANLA